MSRKGINPITATVLIIAFTLSAITLTLTIIKPTLDKVKDSNVINEAIQNLKVISSVIKEVGSEVGGKRVLPLTVTEGYYRVDSSKELLYFEYDTKSDFVPEGVSGEIRIDKSPVYLEFFDHIEDNERPSDWTCSNCKVKSGKLEVEGLAYHNLSKKLINFLLSLEISKATGKPEAFILPTSPINLRLFLPFDEGSGTRGYDYSLYGNNATLYGPRWISGKFGYGLTSLFVRPANITAKILEPLNVFLHGGSDYDTQQNELGESYVKDNTKTGWICDTNSFCNFTLYIDNDNSDTSSGRLNITEFSWGNVYYYASDGSWRNVTELSKIGQGSWSYTTGLGNQTLINYTLAGFDGYDYGIRDAMPGGSYWLDENGNSLDSGLVGYWKFSEGEGTITKDSSGYGNDGLLQNLTSATCFVNDACPDWVDGVYSKGLYLDGVGDLVNISNPGSIYGFTTEPFTIAFWAKYSDQTHRYAGFLGCAKWATEGWSIGMDDIGFGKLYISDAGRGKKYYVGLNLINYKDKWIYLTFVREGTTVKFYLNGELYSTITNYPSALIQSTQPLYVWGTRTIWTVDEVRIYKRVLDDEEIKTLYQAGRIKLQNDFLSVQAWPTIQLNLTNSTADGLYKLITEEIKVDDAHITNTYPANPINNSINVYFFDWEDSRWKIWMKGVNNLTHGMPNWLDPRFKQAFKWRYEFKRTNYPNINLTFLMTAHDPFVRVFIDAVNTTAPGNHNLTIPFVPSQTVKRLGMKAQVSSYIWDNYLMDWNPQFSGIYGNPWYAAKAWVPSKHTGKIGKTSINSGSSVYFHYLAYDGEATSFEPAERTSTNAYAWAHDTTNNIFSFQFYLDNDLQKVNPTTIWDTVVTSDWSITTGIGTLYNDTADYKSGTESLNTTVTSAVDGFISLTYNPAGTWDFSLKEFLALWLKLNDTANWIEINITDSLGNWTLWNRSIPANTLQDLNNTWRRWVLPLRAPTTNSTYPADLTIIDKIEIKLKVTASTGYWLWIDDIVIDEGQWVKVESFVPDKLQLGTYYYTSGYRGYRARVKLYSWTGSDWSIFIDPDSWWWKRNSKLYFLDGTRADEIMEGKNGFSGDAWPNWIIGMYQPGKRTETKSMYDYSASEVQAANPIVYSSYYGVSERIGFVIKMPPDDGQDNSTYGISQVKLKLEVYYDDEGKATYEFSNDNNQYYGLQNRLAPYLLFYNYQTNDQPLFITTNKKGAYSSYGSFLQVRADENEVYDKIQFHYDFNNTENNNLMFTLGYLSKTDTYTASQGDTSVPDIFEGYKTWNFSLEAFENIANSTLTWYDITSYSKTGITNGAQHNFTLAFHYNDTYVDEFNVEANYKTYNYFGVEDSSTKLQPITPFGAVLHLRFNEGTGTTAKDISGYRNDGTLYNDTTICGNPPTTSGPDYCPTWVNGKFEKALSFDGVNDYVNTPTPNPGESTFTVCAWIKNPTDAGRIISYDSSPTTYGASGDWALSLGDPGTLDDIRFFYRELLPYLWMRLGSG
jgi:flagellin-like protein